MRLSFSTLFLLATYGDDHAAYILNNDELYSLDGKMFYCPGLADLDPFQED